MSLSLPSITDSQLLLSFVFVLNIVLDLCLAPGTNNYLTRNDDISCHEISSLCVR